MTARIVYSCQAVKCQCFLPIIYFAVINMQTMRIENALSVPTSRYTKGFSSLEEHDLQNTRPIFKAAKVYYTDFNAEQKKIKFTLKTHDFNFICKATDLNASVTRKEQDLIANINNMIKGNVSRVAYLSHDELSYFTGNNKRQNNIMRKNISHIFKSKWHKAKKIDGVVRRKVIIFRYTPNGEAILDNPLEYYKKIKAGSRVPTSIYKDEKNIKDRSNTQARESISCKDSSFVNSKENNIPAETKELVSEKECCFENNDSNKQTSVIETKVGKFRPNKRRKKTNSEIKLKKAKLATGQNSNKAKIIRPVFYSKPKSLADMNSLLDQETYDDLRSDSGRDFSNNFIAQRLLAMSKKRSLANHNFKTRKGFVSYMSLVLKYELYDAVKTASVDFRLKANITEIDRITQEQERFLVGIENSMCITPEWQFKKKLVSVLSPCKAYKLLQIYICLEIKNNVLRIQLTESVELSELEKEVILNQAKSVYENTSGEDIVFIEKLEFIATKDKTLRASGASISKSNDRPESNLPQGIWGDICKKLIAEYGVHVYRNWFSKLNAEVDEVAKTLTLKAINDLTKDWISSNYQDMISSITSIAGFKLISIES